jgi:hypothetical protein
MEESMEREEIIASIAHKLIAASDKVNGLNILSAKEMSSVINLDAELKGILENAKEEIERNDIEVEEVMAYMEKKRPDMINETLGGKISSEAGIMCTVRKIPMDEDEKYLFKSAPRDIRARLINGLGMGGAINLFKKSISEFGAMPCVFIFSVEEANFKVTQGFHYNKNKDKEADFEKAIEALIEKESEEKSAVIEIRRVFIDKVRMVVRVRGDDDLGVYHIHYFKCNEDGDDISTEALKSFDDAYSHNKWVSMQICDAINKDNPDGIKFKAREDSEIIKDFVKKNRPSPEEGKAPTGNKFKNRLNEMGD